MINVRGFTIHPLPTVEALVILEITEDRNVNLQRCPPALAALAKLAGRGLVWADCEALERRHNLGRGTFVVLDVIPESGTPSYEQRRALLEFLLPSDAVFSGDTSRVVPCGAVVLTPTTRADLQGDALSFYQRLRVANHVLGCNFFEGSG